MLQLAVKKANSLLNLSAPPVNTTSLANKLGFSVKQVTFKSDANRKDFLGFYDAEEKSININSEKSLTTKNFTIAKCVGCFLMNQNNKIIEFRNSIVSSDADEFARQVLIPKDMLKEYYKKTTNYNKLARIFGVPYEEIEIRLKSLGMY